jgi:hypothetical protein
MIAINPVITTNAAGTFSITLDGYIQGNAEDDPAMRYQLTGGQLAITETLPMFGGVPIVETIPPLTNLAQRALQNQITRATAGYTAVPTLGMMTGISVFNQNHAMVNSPQSPVPQADPGMLVNLYRWGSNARIPMAMDPAMAPPGQVIFPVGPLYWDVANQRITQTAAGNLLLPPTVKLINYNIGNSMTVAYNAATGFCTWVRNGSCVLLQI